MTDTEPRCIHTDDHRRMSACLICTDSDEYRTWRVSWRAYWAFRQEAVPDPFDLKVVEP